MDTTHYLRELRCYVYQRSERKWRTTYAYDNLSGSMCIKNFIIIITSLIIIWSCLPARSFIKLDLNKKNWSSECVVHVGIIFSGFSSAAWYLITQIIVARRQNSVVLCKMRYVRV